MVTLAFVLAMPMLVLCQIPASEPLAPSDEKAFREEIQRIEGLLETAGDKCTVRYALARTWAAGHQWDEGMRTLEQAIGMKVGLDPESDEIFSRLRGTREYASLLRQVREDTPPIVHSRAAFTVDDGSLFPEGIAYSPRQKLFFLGSTFHHRIVACTFTGKCRSLVNDNQDGLAEVLGLRVSPTDGTLWAASNSADESDLFHYNVPSGKLIRKYTLGPRAGPHLFNDLVVSGEGDVFVTDTAAGTVYWLSHATDRLEVFNPALRIDAANGIAIDEEGHRKLYVAGFPDGITAVDVASRSFHAIAHPANLCLATIDGLYYFDGSLAAIQNGIMVHRVVRYHLTRDLSAIDGFEVLERRNPLFDGITTGAIAGGAFYFMANTQDDRVQDGKIKPGAHLDPIRILRLDLRR